MHCLKRIFASVHDRDVPAFSLWAGICLLCFWRSQLGMTSRERRSGRRHQKEGIVSRRLIGFVGFLGLVLIGQVALAQDFSADIVSSKQGGGSGKLFSTKDKERWEMAERDPRMGQTALVIDEAQHKSFVLMEQHHMYMDTMPMMTKNPVITQFWHVQDVNDACPQWKKTAEQAKTDANWGSCSKVGSDSLNGRGTVKYEGVSKKGEKSYYWIDTKLKCVIKAENSSGTFELRNIQEASQPASLFEVPAGYQKFDMGAMMGRMGQQQQ